jgi:hypothetical protein
MIEAEIVAWRRARQRVPATVRRRRTALRREMAAAIRRPGLKPPRRSVDSCHRYGGGRGGGERDSRSDSSRGWFGGVMEKIRSGGEITGEKLTAIR